MIIAKVDIDDNRFVSIKASPQDLAIIEKSFTFKDISACWMNGTFHAENAFDVSFLVRKKNIPTMALLPIGFKRELAFLLEYKKAKYKISDNRTQETFNFTDDEIKKNLGYIELYDYQIDAVKTCLEKTNGIIKSPTGSGKTELFISLCNLMQKRTLILFARIDLAKQTLVRMKDAGIDAGIVQGNNVDEDHQVVMVTVQSAHKLKHFAKYDMIVVDEVHRASGDQYQEILRNSKARYRFGFSATPFVHKDKLRDARTKSFIGDIICEVKTAKLIEEKKIAKPLIHVIDINKPFNISNSTWFIAEKYGIIANQYRNDMIKTLVESLTGQILILVKKIDHGKTLNDKIANSHFLYGETATSERSEIVERFDKGDDFILIASTIFDEGINIININHLVIAGGGASYIKVLQRIGRGMRITKTKKTVNIYDFMDDINPILLKHSEERVKIYKKEGFDHIVFLDNNLQVKT